MPIKTQAELDAFIESQEESQMTRKITDLEGRLSPALRRSEKKIRFDIGRKIKDGGTLLAVRKDPKLEGWYTILRVTASGEYVVCSCDDYGDMMGGDYYQSDDLRTALNRLDARGGLLPR